MQSQWLNCLPYFEGALKQREAHTLTLQDQKTRVLGLEHFPIVTLGVRGNAEQDLPFGSSPLKTHNIEIIKIDRGGQATLHSPGQLVIYPIVKLEKYNLSVHEFVDLLMQTTVQMLKSFGIESSVGECQTGVFTARGKIAFCGLRIDRKVSRHGLSINVSNNLALFDLIRPCGCQQAQLDKVENYQQQPKTDEIFRKWMSFFKANINAKHNSLLISSQSLDC